MSKSVWKIRPDGKTVRRRHKNKIEGPFVPLLKDTLKTPAWKALSYGARCLYVVLRWRYNTNLMNAVYVSVRVTKSELGRGSYRDLMRWFRELEYYGFIVKVRLAHHGVNGHGRAPHWRLTDSKYLGKEPTRDFLQWNGKRFPERSREAKRVHRLHTVKKQNPRYHGGNAALPTPPPCAAQENGTSVTNATTMSGNGSVTNATTITSQPLAKAERPERTLTLLSLVRGRNGGSR